jgi:hypothetical protein
MQQFGGTATGSFALRLCGQCPRTAQQYDEHLSEQPQQFQYV